MPHVSPTKERKRALEEEERVVKRSCLEASPQSATVCSSTSPLHLSCPEYTRVWETDPLELQGNITRDSISPDASSVFDADSTQNTTVSSLEGDRQRAQARKVSPHTPSRPVRAQADSCRWRATSWPASG